MSIKVNIFDGGTYGENTYVLTENKTGKTIVIDPGSYRVEIKKVIDESKGLKYIILTHAHGDHIKECEKYIELYPEAKLIANISAKERLGNYKLNKSDIIFGRAVELTADMYVEDNETMILGDSKFTFISTPGHTEDGMCILVDGILFSGDTLFKNTIGRTDLPGGDFEQIIISIKEKLFKLPDETLVYPGHGDTTYIGTEKRTNPFV